MLSTKTDENLTVSWFGILDIHLVIIMRLIFTYECFDCWHSLSTLILGKGKNKSSMITPYCCKYLTNCVGYMYLVYQDKISLCSSLFLIILIPGFNPSPSPELKLTKIMHTIASNIFFFFFVYNSTSNVLRSWPMDMFYPHKKELQFTLNMLTFRPLNHLYSCFYY